MNEFYQKLVDLYADGELTEELQEELESSAFRDSDLSYEMTTMKKTVDLMHNMPDPTFTEESYQRILMKLYARGADLETKAPSPAHLQYSLPIQT
jgi:anti-sigma factor RsiW